MSAARTMFLPRRLRLLPEAFAHRMRKRPNCWVRAKIRNQLSEVTPAPHVIEKPGAPSDPAEMRLASSASTPVKLAIQRRKQRERVLPDDLLLCQSEQCRDADSWVVLERQLLRRLPCKRFFRLRLREGVRRIRCRGIQRQSSLLAPERGAVAHPKLLDLLRNDLLCVYGDGHRGARAAKIDFVMHWGTSPRSGHDFVITNFFAMNQQVAVALETRLRCRKRSPSEHCSRLAARMFAAGLQSERHGNEAENSASVVIRWDANHFAGFGEGLLQGNDHGRGACRRIAR